MVLPESDLPRQNDLKLQLEKASRIGGAHVPEFLDANTVTELNPFCRNLRTEYVQDVTKGGSKKLMYVPKFTEDQEQVLKSLGENVQNRLKVYGNIYPALQDWRPNEYSIQKYDKDSFISSHADSVDYRGVVVLLTLQGASEFMLSDKKDGQPIAAWKVIAGDAVILKAKGFAKNNLQPHHAVGGALTSEPRISLKIAYNPKIEGDFSIASQIS